MSAHTVFIVNPISGQGAGKLAADELQKLTTNDGLDSKLVLTEEIGHAIRLAREAASAGTQVVVAVGGDGTANEVLNGLMQARQMGSGSPAMGVIGVGRGNDFAFGVGVPAGLEAGYRILMQGRQQPMDVGFAKGGLYPEGRFFGNGVGIGFDAVVGFEAAKLKKLHGFANYFVQAPLVRIEMDDNEVKLPALMVSIMNGRRMGGGFMMAPQSKIEDGLFDLCIVGQVSRMGILGLIPQFTKGTQAGHPKVSMRQSRLVTVVAEQGSLPAHADGETLCTEGKTLTVELLPGALDMICPGTESR